MLAAANVYVQMNVPIEPPFFPRTIHPASPTEITVHDKQDRSRRWRRTRSDISKRRIPEEFRKHVENGRQVYYRNCVFCHGDNMAGNGMFAHGAGSDPDQLRRRRDAPEVSRDIPLLADLQGRSRAARGRGALGHGHAGVGEVPEGRRDLGGGPVSLRFHRPEASRPGGGRRQ